MAIIGAGWSGPLAAYHLKKAGTSTFGNIDSAGDFGGVWYWNRYPGIQSDKDAYCYPGVVRRGRPAGLVVTCDYELRPEALRDKEGCRG